jgi:saccharopepsin
MIEAGLGSPSQQLRLTLNLESSGLFIATCSDVTSSSSQDQPEPSSSDSSCKGFYTDASTTYKSNSNDEMSVGASDWFNLSSNRSGLRQSLEIPSQSFYDLDSHHAAELLGVESSSTDSGMIGLAPFEDDPNVPLGRPLSPLEEIKRNGLLERNVFGVQLPSATGDGSQQGHLTLGSLDPEYEDSTFTVLPLSSQAGQRWAVDVSAISLGWPGATTSTLDDDLEDGYQAVFSTTRPLELPQVWVTRILGTAHAELGRQGPSITFPCERREKMPILTLTLAGKDLSLNGFEYTQETSFGDETVCYIVVERERQEKTIGLGWPFMQRFYTVFDNDNREVRG